MKTKAEQLREFLQEAPLAERESYLCGLIAGLTTFKSERENCLHTAHHLLTKVREELVAKRFEDLERH